MTTYAHNFLDPIAILVLNQSPSDCLLCLAIPEVCVLRWLANLGIGSFDSPKYFLCASRICCCGPLILRPKLNRHDRVIETRTPQDNAGSIWRLGCYKYKSCVVHEEGYEPDDIKPPNQCM